MPEVKKFIYEDIPLFHDAEFKKIPGAPPRLLFLNAEGQTVKLIDLSGKNREECNQLLIDYGFYKKADKDEEVPEQYKNGPVYEFKDEL